MSSAILQDQADSMLKSRPDIRPGYTVRVHQKVQEGDKQRIQIFEGLVIAMHRGQSPADHTITVRKIASGVGVERVFPVHSALIEKIEVKKVAKVRRAKLNFLRFRTGKKARLSERFTSAEEFAVSTPPQAEDADGATTEEVEPVEAAPAVRGPDGPSGPEREEKKDEPKAEDVKSEEKKEESPKEEPPQEEAKKEDSAPKEEPKKVEEEEKKS